MHVSGCHYLVLSLEVFAFQFYHRAIENLNPSDETDPIDQDPEQER
jgi:hypothetical protein